MKAENKSTEVKKDSNVNANVCFYTDKICLNCRKFDSRYHGGYCDYHKVDTKPTNSCSDFWER